MEAEFKHTCSYRSNDKGDHLIGVVISNSIAGWSTWNGEKAHQLITDALLIEHIEAERFPHALQRDNDSLWYPGLTKREYFAGLAMQGMLATETHASEVEIAKWAISHADELLKQLDKPKTL